MTPSKSRRLIYNYDAWGPFIRPETIDDLQENVDILQGTQVTTVMLSPNFGQSMCYPSEVSELCHWREHSPEEKAVFHHEMGPRFARASEWVARQWRKHGMDAFGVLVQDVVKAGLEVFATIRMNDVHCLTLEERRGPYTDKFYREHPEYRLQQSGGLNYAFPEVRAHRLACLEEMVRRYPFAGLELDFMRGVPFFPGDTPPDNPYYGQHPITYPRDYSEGSIPIMTEFIGEIRRMLDRVCKELGRKIELAVRVSSSLSGCRRVGLDPVDWHRRGYLDFLTIGRFLQIHYELPVGAFKRALPGLPVLTSIDYVLTSEGEHGVYVGSRDATAEIYRGVAAALYAQGSDGLSLFNMYVCRGNNCDPAGKEWHHMEPVEILRQVGDQQTLAGTSKLYAVDAVSPMFNHPFVDPLALLPGEVSPRYPLVLKLMVGESNAGSRQCRLRVTTDQPAGDVAMTVQLNGHGLGGGSAASTTQLFDEPYDQTVPNPARSRDFEVDGSELIYGENEVVVLAAAPLKITNVELAVTG
jgi:hypothetical protein|uniref:hypothetical protein n=1 Tax=Cephaloticoccus sp. TaxID=1985742 RepID=UPI00404AAA8C